MCSASAQPDSATDSKRHAGCDTCWNLSARRDNCICFPKCVDSIMSSGSGGLKQLWHKWKALRLPWRKKFLAGTFPPDFIDYLIVATVRRVLYETDTDIFTGEDLAGNTYWEFKDTINASRLRRIVKYQLKHRTNYADVQMSRTSRSILPTSSTYH